MSLMSGLTIEFTDYGNDKLTIKLVTGGLSFSIYRNTHDKVLLTHESVCFLHKVLGDYIREQGIKVTAPTRYEWVKQS